MPASDKVRNLLQDPSAAIIANLLGFGVKPSSRGGFRITSPDDKKALDFVTGTPFEGLLGLTTPVPLTGTQELLTGGDFDLGTLGLAGLFDSLGQFDDTILPSALEAAETGFRSDPEQLVSDALARVGEEFSFLTGPFSADLGARATEEVARLNFAADEAAAGRRLQALPLAGLLSTTRAGLPQALGADILGFGQTQRQILESARPETQALNVLLALQGGSPFSAIPSVGSTGLDASTRSLNVLDILGGSMSQSYGSSLGQGLGAATMMCWAAAEYFGWFTPDWWDARNWIAKGWQGPLADQFRRFYLRHGRTLAARIRSDLALKARLEPFFVWARERGHGC